MLYSPGCCSPLGLPEVLMRSRKSEQLLVVPRYFTYLNPVVIVHGNKTV
jgi:hypothetical protein